MRSPLQNERGNVFLSHQNLIRGPLEPNASVLLMSYTDPKMVQNHLALSTFRDNVESLMPVANTEGILNMNNQKVETFEN